MRGWWLALLLGLSFPAGAVEPPAVRLGLVVPMASDAGPAAQSMRRAADMALDDWAPKLDRSVELSVVEDAFDPRQAAVAAEKLVRQGVWGVVGHFYSSSSVAASGVYHAAGVPQVTATSTHPRLTAQGLDGVFRVCGRDDQQAQVAAEFILTRLKARRIGVVHDRTEYGRGLIQALRRDLGRRGLRVLAEGSLAQGDRDFGPQVARLKGARLDAIYFGGTFREAGYLLRQLRAAGVHAPFVGGDAVLDPEFVALAGEEAARGAYLTAGADPRRLVSAQPLIQRYTSRYGSLGSYVVHTYDAVGVLLRALGAAKPADRGQQELRAVARAIRAKPYDGALGTLRWDRSGDLLVAPYAIYVTKRGGAVGEWFEQVSVGTPGAARVTPSDR